MDLKLGDFVRFVDENIEGYITRIIDKDTIGVTDSNDFEIPVLASKVTLVHGDVHDNDIVSTKPTTIIPQAEFKKDGIHLALVADQHSASVAHFHIINESSYQLLASLTTEKQDNFKGEFAGTIAPNSAKRIYSAQLGDIQIWPKFRLEVLTSTSANIEPKAPIIFNKSIKGKDLSVAKEEVALLKQKGWVIKLEEPEEDLDLKKLQKKFQ
ncbi:MAG: hypothetical protein WC623_01940 [Pedobacter sp.]|uniref:hypothetical protein n=1 Tax=Pedobacter sp. TaxID=1411316 RepID=UPI0035630282